MGFMPTADIPHAMPTMFASAMPQSMARSVCDGSFAVPMQLIRSASR